MTKPKVIFVLIDDLVGRDLACDGSTCYETSNPDQLAELGVRFTDGVRNGKRRPRRARSLLSQVRKRTGRSMT